MAIIKKRIEKGERPSEEQRKRIRDNKKEPEYFDDESPKMSAEMFAKFKRVNPRSRLA